MAVAVDGSTPIRFTGAVLQTNGGTITSASFTAPANALLVLCAQYDTNALWTAGTRTASDSGGLAWTLGPERLGNETTAGGASGIWWARTTSATSRTVSFALGVGSGSGTPWGTGRVSALCYVLTGVDVDGTPVDTFGANNEGGSTTNSISTTSITPGANGLLFVSDCDWAELGVFQSSSDLTQDTADYSGAISVCSGYKTCTSGVGVTGNLNAAGTGAAQHKWTQIIVREVAASANPWIRPLSVQQAVKRASYY